MLLLLPFAASSARAGYNGSSSLGFNFIATRLLQCSFDRVAIVDLSPRDHVTTTLKSLHRLSGKQIIEFKF